MFTTSKHHPNGGAVPLCDNAQLEAAIFRYQAGEANALGEVIRLVEPRAQTLIRFHKTHLYRPEDELLSDINFKLMRSIGKFDARRASGFAYISKIIDSSLRTSVANQRRTWQRYAELDSALVNTLPAKTDDWERADDLIFKVKSQARTTLTDETELSACRWLVESFCQDGFASRRHACADACMGVFQISYVRSRELHDLAMLEVRRVLYGDLKPRKQITPGHLLGTRAAWMARYAPLLSESEFTRFAILMANLAPYLMLLILDPSKANNHRADRNPAIGRRNLELILYGCPDAKPLFYI
jgi:hypothetical protein